MPNIIRFVTARHASSVCPSKVCPVLVFLFVLPGNAAENADHVALLRKNADDKRTVTIVTVLNKQLVAPSGDKHDYFALSPYHWPNPKTADGKPFVFRDGKVNPLANSSDYDRGSYFAMGDAIPSLAVAYNLTRDERYAARATEWIRAWFVTAETRMNPNFSFAQCIPGESVGLPIGLIRGMTIVDVVRSEHLLRSSAHWSDSDHQQFVAWVRQLLDWLLTSELGEAESKAANNHGTWFAVQVTLFALFVDDQSLARKTLQKVRGSRIRRQISPDGRQPLEMLRSKSWDYSVMNLEGLMLLAEAGRSVDVDLWNYQTPDGRSIRAAFEYLLPFAAKERTWPGEQIQTFRGDKLLSLLDPAIVAWPDSSPKFRESGKKITEPDVTTLLRRELMNVPLTPPLSP